MMQQLDLSQYERHELSAWGITTYQQLKQALVDGRLYAFGWGVERLIGIAVQCHKLEQSNGTNH